MTEYIKHNELVEDGWRLKEVQRGFFVVDGKETEMPVYRYEKEQYSTVHGSISVEVGSLVRYYNDLGLVYSERK